MFASLIRLLAGGKSFTDVVSWEGKKAVTDVVSWEGK